MTRAPLALAGLVLLLLLAVAPWTLPDYWISLLISMLSYTVLATAWALFSGSTGYVSLATAAFFGLGAYVVAMGAEALPMPALIALAALAGAAVATLIGLSTLRLSGMHFVIFTFGLAELIRQVTVWWEINRTGTLGRYVFVEFGTEVIYSVLLALCVGLFVFGWAMRRSRLGLALTVVGADETVARHIGIDTTRVKLAVFALTAAVMAVTGAMMAPRWTYIDPNIAFNPMVSFQTMIMALMGGARRLWGPVLGAVPLVALFELLSAQFPHHFSILLGAVFLAIVYRIPDGVSGLLETTWRAPRRPPVALAEERR